MADLSFDDPPEPTPLRPPPEPWPDPQSIRLANAWRQGMSITLDFVDMTVSWAGHVEPMVVPPRRPK